MLRVTLPFCWLSWNKGGGWGRQGKKKNKKKKKKKIIFHALELCRICNKKKSYKHMQNTTYKLVISEKMCMLAVNQMEELATIY